MNIFDKCCAALAFVLGLLLLILGGLGVFFGSSAHFTLPPILGGLPLLVGWGIVRPIYLAWSLRRADAYKSLPSRARSVDLDENLQITQDLGCGNCNYNLRTLHVEKNCPECGLPVMRSIIRYERVDIPRAGDSNA